MAVSIVTEPPVLTSAGNSLYYKFNQDAGPSAGTVLYFYYRLNVNGTFLTADTQKIKYTGQDIELDFTQQVQGVISNEIKALTDNTTLLIGFANSVYVQYGEIEVDTSTGVAITLSTLTSAQRNVLFGTHKFDEDLLVSDIANNKPIIHTAKPPVFDIFKDGYDWIYFGGNQASSAGINIYSYDRNDNVVDTLGVSAGAGVTTVIPMGGMNMIGGFTLSGIFKFRFEIGIISGAAGGLFNLVNQKNYTAYFVGCNQEPETELYFQEPKGGWSSMRFDRVEFLTNTTRAQAQVFTPYNTNQILRAREGGLTQFDQSSARQFRLSKDIRFPGLAQADYVESLFRSKRLYIRRKIDGVDTPVRCVIVANDNSFYSSNNMTSFSVTVQLKDE